jgi:hypothetical protein
MGGTPSFAKLSASKKKCLDGILNEISILINSIPLSNNTMVGKKELDHRLHVFLLILIEGSTKRFRACLDCGGD